MNIDEIIQNILINELSLPMDYGKDKDGFIVPSCYVYAPNISIGKTDKLQICIQSINSRILSNNNSYKEIDNEFFEIQEIILNDTIQIDVFSSSDEAKNRWGEVVSALHSLYCQYMQEKHHFRVFQIPNNVKNTSSVEGSARLYRWTITIQVNHKKQYIKNADYYDKFKFEYGIDTMENKKQFEIPQN